MFVLIHHLKLCFDYEKYSWPSLVFDYTPLKILSSGHMAVLLFFVLSGFALSALMTANLSYPQYLARRACRIMLPYLAAILISAGLYFLVQALAPEKPPGGWRYNALWRGGVTWETLGKHMLMTGRYLDLTLSGVGWSLVHEWRVSLIFPALFLACTRAPKTSAVMTLALLGAAKLAMTKMHISIFVGETVEESLISTLFYTPFFVLGIYLFLYREKVITFIAARKRWQIALASVAVYFLLLDKHDALTGLGGAGLIALAMGNATFARFLMRGPLPWLGRISYSLYLIHLPLLVTAFRLFGETAPRLVLVAAVFVLAPALAHVFNKTVEDPSTKLGRRLADLMPAGAALACDHCAEGKKT